MSASQEVHFQVDREGARLDQYLAGELPQLSRSQVKKLIQQNQVLVSSHPAKPSARVQPGDLITVYLPPAEAPSLIPQELPIDIVFADEELLVINKAAGMVVHPGHGHRQETLVNALLARYPDLAGLTETTPEAAVRPGIVHRLDQDTSGLMVVARTAPALRSLRRQFKSRQVEKLYLALVHGRPEAPEGLIDVPLGRDPRWRQKVAPRADGKPARTRYSVKTSFPDYSLLEIGLETGRTHQIRVHLAWLGCPVVGDTVYGRKKNTLGLERQFLHAWQLRFFHPRRQEWLHFTAPLSPDLQTVLNTLEDDPSPASSP